jgi:hypothetical protein
MTYAGSADSGPADDTVLAACLGIALEAGAVAKCPMGHPRHYRTFDNRAEARAFAQAAFAQSSGPLAGQSLDRVIGQLGRLLDGLGRDCPDCRR